MTADSQGKKSPGHPLPSWLLLSTLLSVISSAPPCLAQFLGPEVWISAQPSGFNADQAGQDVTFLGSDGIAAWTGYTDTRHIFYATSRDGGRTWIERGVPPPLASGSFRFSGYPALGHDDSGVFYLAFLINPPSPPSIAVCRGSFQSGTFAWSTPIPALPGLDPPNIGLAYDNPQLAVDSAHGILYLTCLMGRTSPQSSFDFRSTVQIVRSLDQGATWSSPISLSGDNCLGNTCALGPDGEVYVAWEDFVTHEIRLRKSLDFGQTFLPVVSVAPENANIGGGPAGYRQDPERINPLVDFCGYSLAANFPRIAVDRGPGAYRGTVYLVWPDYAEGTRVQDVTTRPEQEPNGHFQTANVFNLGDNLTGGVSSSDFGGTDYDYWAFDGIAGTIVELDGQVTGISPPYSRPEPFCPLTHVFCGSDTSHLMLVGEQGIGRAPMQVPPMRFVLPSTGRYYLEKCGVGFYAHSYRLRTRILQPLPTEPSRDQRDLVMARSTDGGVTWTPKYRVNQTPVGVDDLLPELAVDPVGHVHMVWYANPVMTGCGDTFYTYYAQSLNGGQSFSPPLRVSAQPSNWSNKPEAVGGLIGFPGDHVGLSASSESIVVLWTQQGQPDADIYGIALRPDIVPVAPAVLTAQVSQGEVELEITVSDVDAFTELSLERSLATDESPTWVSLWRWRAGEPADGPFRIRDAPPGAGTRYAYRLTGVSRGGAVEILDTQSIDIPIGIAPLARLLSPNPLNGPVRLWVDGAMNLAGAPELFDVSGRLVARLEREGIEDGGIVFGFGGTNGSGRNTTSVTPGTYFLRVRFESGATETLRVVTLR